MTGKGWKWLKMAIDNWKCLKMNKNKWKWVETVGKDYRLQYIAGYCRKWLKMFEDGGKKSANVRK